MVESMEGIRRLQLYLILQSAHRTMPSVPSYGSTTCGAIGRNLGSLVFFIGA